MELTVSVQEGHALEVLDLLCRGRALRITAKEPLTRPRPELVEVAGRRIAASVLRVLVEGGRRERTLLRDGRRVDARVWDRELLEDFALRFSPASYTLWIELTQRLDALARSSQVDDGVGSSRSARRQIRKVVKIAGTGTGDWIFYALAVRHLERATMPEEIRGDLRRRLAMGSPLATLLALEEHTGEGELMVEEQLMELLLPANVRLLECADHLFVDAWIARIRAIPLEPTVPARIVRVQGIVRVLSKFLSALDGAHRLDLVGPIVSLLLRLTDAEAERIGLWAEEPAKLIASLGRAGEFASLAQREALRRAYAELVELGARLWELRDRLADEGYGDRRYEESQLLIERCEPLRSRLGTLMSLAGALTNRLG